MGGKFPASRIDGESLPGAGRTQTFIAWHQAVRARIFELLRVVLCVAVIGGGNTGDRRGRTRKPELV